MKSDSPKPTGYNDTDWREIQTGDVLSFEVDDGHELSGLWLVDEGNGKPIIELSGEIYDLGFFNFGSAMKKIPASFEGNVHTQPEMFLMMADYSHLLLKKQGVNQRRSKWPFASMIVGGQPVTILESESPKPLSDIQRYVHVLASKSGKKFKTSRHGDRLTVERVK